MDCENEKTEVNTAADESEEQVQENTESITYDDGLSKYYDTIVIGTGIVESLLACAIQLLPGKKVLHLDPLDFYGRELSTVNLSQMIDICISKGVQFHNPQEASLDPFPDADAASLCQFINNLPVNVESNDFLSADAIECLETKVTPQNLLGISSFSEKAIQDRDTIFSPSIKSRHPSCVGYTMQKVRVTDQETFSIETTHPAFLGYVLHNKITADRARHEGRKFSLDLSCKLVLAGGSMVESMISSDVGRYLEFKSIENIYLIKPEAVWEVPCSKGDVFNSKLLSAIEKRQLMKFLQFVNDWGQSNSRGEVLTLNERELSKGAALSRPQNKNFNSTDFNVSGLEFSPFQDFMISCKLPQKLQEIILFSLCLETQGSAVLPQHQMSTHDGLRALHLHLTSLGKYGNTAFLYPVYGVAEIPQAFCRMCAVWGGIYILRRGISRVLIDKSRNRVRAVVDDTGRPFGCGNLVCSSSDWCCDLSSENIVYNRISICIGEGAIFPSCPRGFGIIPPGAVGVDNLHAVHVVQLNSSANICPVGCCILYITTTLPKSHDSESLMSRVVAYLQDVTTFEEIYYFTVSRNLHDTTKLNTNQAPSNVAICGEVKQSINFQNCVEKAKALFARLYPGDEFMLPVKGFQSETNDDEENAVLKAALDSLHEAENL